MRVGGKNVFNELDYKNVRKVYLSNNFKDQVIMQKIKDNNLKYVLTDPKVMDKMAPHNQGVIVEINDYEYKEINDIDKDENFVLILDHLEDPHNFGAIIRSCEARGIKHIIIPKDRSVIVNETVMKTSTGALSNVDVIMVGNLVNAMNKLKDMGFFIYAAEADRGGKAADSERLSARGPAGGKPDGKAHDGKLLHADERALARLGRDSGERLCTA